MWAIIHVYLLVGFDNISHSMWANARYDYQESAAERTADIAALVATVIPETEAEWLARLERYVLTESSDLASQLLRRYSAEFGGSDAERLTLQAWAVAHGLAMLMLDGRLPPDDALIDRVLDTKTLFPAQPGKSSEASP